MYAHLLVSQYFLAVSNLIVVVVVLAFFALYFTFFSVTLFLLLSFVSHLVCCFFLTLEIATSMSRNYFLITRYLGCFYALYVLLAHSRSLLFGFLIL
jgi:hypothetical protein